MDAESERYGIPTALLMENAGRAVADAVCRSAPRSVCVVAGGGNNGGDALVAARMLYARGCKVGVVLSKPLSDLRGLAALNARRCADDGVTLEASAESISAYDIIIDGLLGTGIAGAPRGRTAELIQVINASGRPVISIDVPSGIDSDATTAPELAVRATTTVTIGCYKPALVHFPAAENAGQVLLADIGFPPLSFLAADSSVLSGGYVRERVPQWPKDAHKGRRGALLVVAGSRGMTGAPAMSCNAAVNAGAGLVYLACPDPLVPVMERKLTEAMARPVPSSGRPRFSPESIDPVLDLLKAAKAVVLGPGLSQGEGVPEFVAGFLARVGKPTLIDADALNILASLGLTPPPNSVLTPHPGEMARLLGTTVAEVQDDRVSAVRSAARAFNATVVLKGAHTLVCGPDGHVVVNTVSSNVLATGGSGDVLSGVIGALLSQGLSPMDAALVGVRWHGTMGVLAASRLGGTVGAATMLKLLPRAREEMLTTHEAEVLV
ncbi:MAG TPA: NAD(P)H-hydrate dehydratase [Armatimonadota bacterium]